MTEPIQHVPPPDPPPAVGGPDPEHHDPAPAGPLVMLAGDDGMLCIDDTCVPARTEA